MVSAMRGERAGLPVAELTSYVGRLQEAADVRLRLAACRVVTVTGPAGVGKTRLAVRVMRDLAGEFADHAVFVGLAELDDPALLPNLVATRLGLGDAGGRPVMDTVLDNLRDRETLLVLDNCEHLVDACARFTAGVLGECPGVTVLATSRQSLGVPGEQAFHLAPLALPHDAADADLIRCDSVRLFVDRATTAWSSFQLTEENSADVVRLCAQLGGLPLAIELAAARVRALAPGQIADRLTGDLALLNTRSPVAPRRQLTLCAALDWSFDLCSAAERALWARASVFVGSFDLAAAEHVCAGGTDPLIEPGLVLDLVDSLVDKSVLIRDEQDGVGRYRLLEPLRQYGQQRLDDAGDRERTQRRHLEWFDRLTARADAEWASPAQVEWVKRLRGDQANLRAALEWSVREPGTAVVAQRMVVRTLEHWTVCGLNTEARTWLDRAAAAMPADHPERPLALAVAALFALLHSDLDSATARLGQAEDLVRALPDPDSAQVALLVARIAHVRSLAGLMSFDPATATLAADAATAFIAHGNVRAALHPLFVQAIATAYTAGGATGARVVLDRMARLTDACDELFYRSMCHHAIAVVEVEFGEIDRAADAAHEALACTEPLHNKTAAAYVTETMAWVADRQGDHVRAATLFGVAARLWHANGATAEVATSVAHHRHHRNTVAALGQARFDRAFGAGRAMSEPHGREYALGVDSATSAATPLSPREVEIAELVAEGLTNRAIGARLFIAVRTVDTHVRNILTKLEFTNRAQIAAWITEHRS